MQRRRVLGLLATCALAACSMPSLEGDAQRAAEAQGLYADLVEGRDDALLARMSSGKDPATVRAQLPMIRTDTTFLKEGAVWKVENFNVNARMKPAVAAPAAATTAPG